MKISKILFGAAILVIAVTVFSCGGDDGGISLIGIEKVSSLQALPSDTKTVTNEYDIETLLSNTVGSSTFRSMLNSALNSVYSNLPSDSSSNTDLSSKSYSISKKIDDSTELKKSANVALASIKGNVSGKISSNRTLTDIFFGSSLVNGDYYSSSKSGKITYAITDGYYQISSYSTTKYYISGFITIDESGSKKDTLKDKEKNVYESSSNSTKKVSVTVAIYSEDSSKERTGGKFTLAYSNEYSGSSRYANGSSSSITSDILVYNDAGKLVETIKGDEASSYLYSYSIPSIISFF